MTVDPCAIDNAREPRLTRSRLSLLQSGARTLPFRLSLSPPANPREVVRDRSERLALGAVLHNMLQEW
jgi:hypothetical protein